MVPEPKLDSIQASTTDIVINEFSTECGRNLSSPEANLCKLDMLCKKASGNQDPTFFTLVQVIFFDEISISSGSPTG